MTELVSLGILAIIPVIVQAIFELPRKRTLAREDFVWLACVRPGETKN